MSMPRPDAATLWLAKQDVTKGQASRQGLAVLVTLSVLTAICVAGLATLLYLKLVAPAPPAIAIAAEAVPSGPSASLAPITARSDVVVGKPTSPAPRGSVVAAAPNTAPKPGSGSAPTTPATTATPGEEPGYLTIICKPFCDDVRRGSESLGPSPVVKAPVPPGQHRITLTRAGGPDKIISVLVSSGEVRKETIAMK